MNTLHYHQYAYGSDNYGVLIHDDASGSTACVDAGDADAAIAALQTTGWTLTNIWITHHHGDHTAGLLTLKEHTGASALGPEYSSIGGLDSTLRDGDSFDFAGHTVHVLHTPGHTSDMINFHIPSENVVFTGDTLFTLGCGRLFEGDAPQMWQSLEKLIALPSNTTVYSSHEYTLANAAFALSVDPDNVALQNRAKLFKTMRDRNEPTVPSLLSDELATNPFLRADDSAIRTQLDMKDATNAEVFANMRARKDAF